MFSHKFQKQSHIGVQKKLLWKILQNSQENTCVGVSFQYICITSGLQLWLKPTFFLAIIAKFLRKTNFQNNFLTEHLTAIEHFSRIFQNIPRNCF